MRLLKLLTLPAVLLLTGLLAIPVYANHAKVTELTGTCKQTGQICFHIVFTPDDIPAYGSRTITVKLLGRHEGSNDFVETGVSKDITIPGSQNRKEQTVDACFDQVDTSQFVEFKVKVVAGDGIDLDDSTVTNSDKFECQKSTPTPTPSHSASATPSPSASANTVAVLAETGGFDFRFPLIGLALLVAGGALYLISASRGRSADSK